MFHGRSWGPVQGTEVLARGPPFGKWFDSEFRAILHDSQTSATSIVLYTSLRWEWRHIKFKHTHTHTTHSIESKPCLTDKYQMGTSWILDKGTCVRGCLCMCFMWAGRGHTAENTVGSCLCDLNSNNTESLGYMLESITIHWFHFSRDTLHKGSVLWNQWDATVSLFKVCPIIARTWKQPRCPSADQWIRKLWYIYTMEYYSAITKNTFESVLMRWIKLEPIIQSKVSQKDKHQISILMHIYGIWKDGNDNLICKTEKEKQMYRTDFGLYGRRREWDDLREQHQNVYIIKCETDRQSGWEKCSGLVHWDDPEGWDGEGGRRGVQDGEHM